MAEVQGSGSLVAADAASGPLPGSTRRHRALSLLLRPEAGLPLITLALCVYLSFASLAVATGIGLLNGLLIAIGRLNPFIVTLGTNFLFTGIAFVLTAGNSLSFDSADFAKIGQTTIFLDIPTPTVIMFASFATAW